MRLLQFLRTNYREAPSVKEIKRAINGKRCVVNHQTQTFSSYLLAAGDLVVLEEGGVERKRALSVLYEDTELLLVNKPSGVVCDHCLERSLGAELVHRLDKETSGVLILSKSAEAQEKMLALFKERSVRKLYLALVDGIPSQGEGVIDTFLGRTGGYEGQAIYGTVKAGQGKRAITYWKRLKHGQGASLLGCEPHTGRTHQLRVHLSALGHPILGDNQYGKRFACPLRPCRNLLHAYSITFKHPCSGKEIKVVAPIPVDFKQALDQLTLA